MTPAEKNYERADLRLKVARAQLLRQIARDDTKLSDLLQFAHAIGDDTQADTLVAFRSAQTEQLRAAQAELDRLTGPARPGRQDPAKPAAWAQHGTRCGW